MDELTKVRPFDRVLPWLHGECEVTAVTPDVLTWVGPYVGSEAKVSQALGLAWPEPGRVTETNGVRVIWAGRAQALVTGPVPEAVARHAAVVDQSGSWAMLSLTGETASDVLARLVPIDLSPSVFRVGHTARTLCQHVPVSLTRIGLDAFEMACLSSMAGTMLHDVQEAVRGIAARRALG